MQKYGFILALVLGFGSVASADLVVSGYTPQQYERFYVGQDRAFLWDVYNWSGIGHDPNGTWATAISPSYFLTSNHFNVGVGGQYNFYPGDTFDNPVTMTVASVQRIGTSDITIGRFTTPLPSNIAYYQVMSQLQIGQTVVAVGNSLSGQRFGTNPVAGWNNNSQSSLNMGSTEYVLYQQTAAQGSFLFSGGDSGGPTFEIINGAPVLLGEHWGAGSSLPLSFDGGFLGNHLSDVNAILATTGESLGVASVPEPSSLVLLATVGILALVRRLKRLG